MRKTERAGARTQRSRTWLGVVAASALVTLSSMFGISYVGHDADIHPWLREGAFDPTVDGLPTSYPHTVETADGAPVTYDRGPTPAGYAWQVVFPSREGSVEIHAMDDAGTVQVRTYGSVSSGPAEGDAAP